MEKVLEMMDFANGEVRIQPTRYAIEGCNFMCIVSMKEQEDSFWEIWDDMLGGDLEYFDSEAVLTSFDWQGKCLFGFAYGGDPMEAYSLAMESARKALEHVDAQ